MLTRDSARTASRRELRESPRSAARSASRGSLSPARSAAAAAAAALPGLRFVLDHLGKPPVASGRTQPWARDLRALAAWPNTACKLSALVTEADWHGWQVADLRPYADIALDAFGPSRTMFGPSRTMFGSDWPVCTLAAGYGEVLQAARDLTAQLSPDEQAAVSSGTATSVYRL
jgi:L-fuconolactonase